MPRPFFAAASNPTFYSALNDDRHTDRAQPCNYLSVNAECLARRFKTLIVVITLSFMMFVALLALWVRSYSTQDELRWMRSGIHLHLESADGMITFVSTVGSPSGDYFVWESSPDLSYGRDADWYAVSPPGESRWHLRTHFVVPSAMMALVVALAWLKLVRDAGWRTGTTNKRKAPAPLASL